MTMTLRERDSGEHRTSGARNVLVVEDDRDIAGLLALHLQPLGCTVRRAHEGAEGLALARRIGDWALIVLDLQLPGVDGLEICRQVRSQSAHTPILVLTARAGESERVLGLETGADDYLTKPFSVVEFAARVKALLRRAELSLLPGGVGLRTVRVGDLHIDLDRRLARRGAQHLDLTTREFALLAFLMQRPGRVYSRAQLLDQVWGTTHDTYEHTVNSHINRLRAKVERDASQPQYIRTVWGTGYRFAMAGEVAEHGP
jgi:DNA-binding response OmpR family regulator